MQSARRVVGRRSWILAVQIHRRDAPRLRGRQLNKAHAGKESAAAEVCIGGPKQREDSASEAAAALRSALRLKRNALRRHRAIGISPSTHSPDSGV